MRLIFIFTLLTCATTYRQTRLFDLNKLDGDFDSFLSQKKVIVVGEMHGTTEVPQFVLHLMELMSDKNSPLTVGLEIERNFQKEIDAFLINGDFDKLLKLDYFKYPDGRTSVAMGELIKGLRKIEGIKVVCFDIESGLDAGVNRDSLMAVNLNNNFTDGQMIVLTGNLHANLKEGYWRPNFKSAIHHFNRMKNFGDQLISLNTYFGGGTIWNCMKDGCKERDAGSNPAIRERFGLDNFIGVYSEVHSSGYSGFVYFDKVTASMPLVN